MFTNPWIVLMMAGVCILLSLLFNSYYWGIPSGIYTIYTVLFHDKKHYWNGEKYVDLTKENNG